MATQKFSVPGVTQSAARALQERLVGIDGVIYAAVSHSDRCAEVEFEDDEVTIDELRRAIGELGVEARITG